LYPPVVENIDLEKIFYGLIDFGSAFYFFLAALRVHRKMAAPMAGTVMLMASE
jgi:hypothetical protein